LSKAASGRSKFDTEEEPEIAHDENMHPDGPMSTYDKRDEKVPSPSSSAASKADQLLEAEEKREFEHDKHLASSDEPEVVHSTHSDGSSSNEHVETGEPTTAVAVQAAAEESAQYDKCMSELTELTNKQQKAVSEHDNVLDVLLTLGGTVQPPSATERKQLGESNEMLQDHVKAQIALSVSKACKQSSSQSAGAEEGIEALQKKKDFYKKQSFDLSTKLRKAEMKLKLQKADQKKELESEEKQLVQLKQQDSKLESELYELLAELQPNMKAAKSSVADSSESVIDQLRELFENQENVEPKDWSELADQLLEHHRTVKVEGLTDPVAVGTVYLVATLPVMGLVCLSRFASIKEIFIVQGVFANCCFTGIWLILAVLALYCGFNPLKLIIGHEVHLPTFELVFVGAYAYVSACNILLLFVQRGAMEKLHAFFTLLLGAHIYWMLYTLRTEELGSEIQVMFYFVYFVCFAGFSLAKLQGLTALHFGSVTNARRAKQASRAGKGTAVPISDDKGAAVFELGEDWEADGLTANSAKTEWKADFD